MRKIFLQITSMLLLLVGFQGIVSAQITVVGAGSDVNGTYDNTFTYNGKPAYERTSGITKDILWRSDVSEWRFTEGNGSGRYYYNTANTATPPNVGWLIGESGTVPAPVAGGSITSLLVGDGTSGNPYQISTLNSLYWIAFSDTAWGKSFVQTVDIDASETSSWSGGGWTVIGNFTTYFTGSYDGGHFAIDGLTINRAGTNDQGLFGVIYQGSVTNLGMTNVNITGNSGVAPITSYLYIDGSISNCYTTGTVSGTAFAAGLAAHVHTNSIVSTSLSSCTVTATEQAAGGLVSRFDQSSIENSLFLGSVWGDEYVGGVTGFLYQSTVTNCYSAGAVAGNFSLGGLVGANNSSTVSNSFWDIEVSGRSTSAGGTGKTTAEMKTQATFTDAGWDFEGETTNGTNDYWDLNVPVVYNNGYPFLAWQTGTEIGMPVELISLSVSLTSSGVKLEWKTATEVNNHGFEVERKTIDNGQLTMHNWKNVGFVEGNGTSNSPKSYSFSENVVISGTYAYRLKQIDRDGSLAYSPEVEVTVGTAPKEFALDQNFPNPFNPATTMLFSVQVTGKATLKVYNAIGQEVATLFDGIAEAGQYHQATFNASNLASGIYFSRLTAEGKSLVRKLMLMK
ncbi:MAG: T9SS type A sorting domain-containing protein [Bacteroidota bacterium]